MGFVMIPPGYDPARDFVVPICIRDEDDDGRPIPQVWFDAVSLVQDWLRDLAKVVLGDEWLVSELAEHTVHTLARRHGSNAGDKPGRRVYLNAIWEARNLAAGDQWLRKHRHAFYSLSIIDTELRLCLEEAFKRTIMLDSLDKKLSNSGKTLTQRAYRLFRCGCDWDEIRAELEIPADRERAFRRSFYRVLRRAS
jgi:hypothetical protein